MNKQQLIEYVASETKNSKAGAAKSLDAVLWGISKGLRKSRRVQLIGFGTFAVKNRKARRGRNPQTGKAIQIKASRTVGFKPSADLKKGL